MTPKSLKAARSSFYPALISACAGRAAAITINLEIISRYTRTLPDILQTLSAMSDQAPLPRQHP